MLRYQGNPTAFCEPKHGLVSPVYLGTFYPAQETPGSGYIGSTRQGKAIQLNHGITCSGKKALLDLGHFKFSHLLDIFSKKES